MIQTRQEKTMAQFTMNRIALFLLLAATSVAALSSSSCDNSTVCGDYGICTQGQCSCPYSFSPKKKNNTSKGCKQGTYNTTVLALTGATYIPGAIEAQISNYSTYLNCLQAANDCELSFFDEISRQCYCQNKSSSVKDIGDFAYSIFFTVKDTGAKSQCDEPYTCRSYGVCNNNANGNKCSCPEPFFPINASNISMGCSLGNGSSNSSTGFLALNRTHSSYQLPNHVVNHTNPSDCMNMCNGNFKCMVTFDAENQTCFQMLGTVGTLSTTDNPNLTTYLWIGKMENKTAINCDAPDACGHYEICSEGQCSCPQYFVNSSRGCVVGTGYKNEFLEIRGITYSDFQGTYPFKNVTSPSNCKQSCSQNTSCTAAFFNSTGNCVLMFTQIGSLKNTSNQNDFAFLKVNPKQTSQRKSSLSAGALIGIIVGIMFIVCVITLALYLFVTCHIKKDNRDIESKEPANHVQINAYDEGKDIIADHEQQNGKDVTADLGIGIKVYSYSEIQGVTKDYKDKICEDRFAALYKAQTENGIHLTVKVLKITGDFSAEISTISQMHHTNLVQLLGYCNQGSHRVLVYEYVVNDSLDAWIFNNIISPMSWKKRFNIITGIAAGMAYLHEHQVLHLDLKAQDIFLDAKFDAKIGHFGLNRLRDNLIGSPEYVVPEYFIGTDRDGKMDVYSFGVILLEIVSAERVLNLSGQSVTDAVANCGNEEFFPRELVDNAIQYSVDEVQAKKVIQVAFLCLQRDPEKRPSMSDVLLMLEGKAPLQLMPSTQEIMLQQCFTFKP